MKKLFTLLSLFVSVALSAQVNTQPPKIILQIDSIVSAINNLSPKAKKSSFTDSTAPNYWTKHHVSIYDNTINKITEEAKREATDITRREYYFNDGQIIKIHITYINPQRPKPENNTQVFYFDYNELMSEPSMLVLADTTIYLHIAELKYGYQLIEKYKHLQNYNPFKNLKYDKVVAYDFDGTGDDRSRIVKNGKLHPSTKKLQNKTLTKYQTDSLLNFLADTSTFGGNHAFCFEPRLGIVFYDGKKIVADINICFACNSLLSSVYLPAEVHHKLIYGGDDYLSVLPQTGFSPIGRKQLKQLCHNLGLGLCPPMDDESMFDETNDK
jgi:hypothetical protein